jgi:hypothetical protein
MCAQATDAAALPSPAVETDDKSFEECWDGVDCRRLTASVKQSLALET